MNPIGFVPVGRTAAVAHFAVKRIGMFFDSLCHLSDERLFAELGAVLERADAAQVSRVDLEDENVRCAVPVGARGARLGDRAGGIP
jgi:hypothetical protein